MIENRPILCLWGFMGTGKSTVGQLIAERCQVGLTDLDAEIVRRSGRAISEIFEEEGEAAFRDLERAELLRAFGAESLPRVIALGGGALLDPRSRSRALDDAFVVTLTARIETIVHRTAGDGARPLLAGDVAISRRLLDARAAAYSEAHAVIATDGQSASEIAERLLKRWKPTIG